MRDYVRGRCTPTAGRGQGPARILSALSLSQFC